MAATRDTTMIRRLVFPVLIGFVLLTTAACKEAPVRVCSVCADRSSVSLPNNVLPAPRDMGSGDECTCGQLDLLLPALYPDSSHPDCQAFQSVGSVCGCPTPANKCTICPDGVEMISRTRPLPFFSEQFGGITPDCELVDAVFRSSLSQDDARCSMARSYLPEYCECLNVINDDYNVFDGPCTLCDDGAAVSFPDKELNIGEGFPFSTCGQIEEAVSTLFEASSDHCALFQSISSLCCSRKANSCSMCRGDADIAFPDKPVRFLKELFGGITPTCSVFEAYGHSLKEGSDECSMIQTSGGFCGCPPIWEDDQCEICPNEELKSEFEQVEIDPQLMAMGGYIGDLPFPLTCELVISFQKQYHMDDSACKALQARSDLCGCKGQLFSTAHIRWFTWLPRLSAILTMCGTLAIVVDVVRSKTKRNQIYNQIVAAMSVFDFICSIAFAFSIVASPANDFWPRSGERGNSATCKAQAFIVQLSNISIAYNTSLATYYFVVVVLGWKREKLQSISKYLHAIPIVLGFSLAFAGIPYYGMMISHVCHIQVPLPPLAVSNSWLPLILLRGVPVSVGVASCTILTFLVWLKVRRQVNILSNQQTKDESKASDKPPSNISGSTLSTVQTVEREIRWQALFYLVAFYLSWISTFVALRYGLSYDRPLPFGFYGTTAFLRPLQGFLNSLNYFRPRLTRVCVGRRTSSENPDGENEVDVNDLQASRLFSISGVISNDEPSAHLAEKGSDSKFDLDCIAGAD